MKASLISAALVLVCGCSAPQLETVPARESIPVRMTVEKYEGMKSRQVPFGKCVAVAYPRLIKTKPTDLDLLLKALETAPELTTADDIWIYLTPKRSLLAALDFVRPNDLSQRHRNSFSLSFDFVQYAGPIEEHPGEMSCVIGFNLGQLPKGTYKVSVMNSFLQYQEIGKDSEAKPVPKSRIHPDTFWHEIEFTVK